MDKYTANGVELPQGQSFKLNGNSYQSNFFDSATPQDLIDHGITHEIVADLPPVPITADQVRSESNRRILAVFPLWRQENAKSRALELLRIRIEVGSWTSGEQIEVDKIQAGQDWIKTVQAASNVLEVNPPPDYKDDIHWPGVPA